VEGRTSCSSQNWKLFREHSVTSQDRQTIIMISLWFHPHTSSQEAADVMRDATGRWVSFVVSGQSLLLVERKTVPDHLAALSSLDTVASLDEILLELQDAGEAILS